MSFEKQNFLCNLCQQCSMYEDMKNNIDFIIKNKKSELNNDEKKFLIISYKNLINKYRESIIILNEKLIKEKNNLYKKYINEYKNKLIFEFFKFINNLIANLNELVQNTKEKENKILYYKLLGDYYRYLNEIYDDSSILNKNNSDKKENFNQETKENKENKENNNDNINNENKIENKENIMDNINNNINSNKQNNFQEKYIKLCLENYEKAINLCDDISYKNALKLELLLNISVFYYDIVKDKELAITISRETLDNVKIAFKDIEEENEEYKNSINIINILSENIELWTKETNFELIDDYLY